METGKVYGVGEMMQLGYYWARRSSIGGDTNVWVIVEVVRGLHGAVLEDGCSVRLSRFDEFVGPMPPPPQSGCKPCWIHPPVTRPEFHVEYEDEGGGIF